MAIPRGQTPRPYIRPDFRHDTTDPYHQQQYPQQYPQPPLRPVHGDNDAYGPHTYGGRAHKTVPMPYHPAIDDDIELQIRGKCQNCHGKGVVKGRETKCVVCRRRYLEETVRRAPHYGFRNRRVLLPCHHEAREGEMIWTPPQCIYCEGDGYLYRWVRWGDYVTALYGAEDGDAELDEQTTAALRALRRAATPQSPQVGPADPFTRSGEPTAPAPHLAPHLTGVPQPMPNQERLTPPVGPHLPPLAPERESGESF